MDIPRPPEVSPAGDLLPRLIAQVQDSGSAVMFVSPHLDDAVLSCGALITHLARTCPVIVLTIFSAAARPPISAIAARKQLRDLGVGDAAALFAVRRAEDIAVLQQAGASWVHLGLTDALYRRVDEMTTPRKSTKRAAYPTYRFHAARGKIASSESGLAARIAVMIKETAAREGASTIFGPLGVGRHVDHLITRNAVAITGEDAVYYSDFPYSETEEPDDDFIQYESLVSCTWLSGRAESVDLMTGYRTQIPGLFPHGIPISPETYWFRATDSAKAT